MLQIRASIYYTVTMILTVVHSLLCLTVASWLPFRLRYRFVTTLNRIIIQLGRWVCGVRYEVEGQENLPKDRPFVILANHQSEWETFYLQLLVGPMCTVLKKELLRIPFFGWGLAMLKPIAINRAARTNAMKQILQQGKARLKEGIPVLIFPQGTRIPAGETGRFNKGGAMLACSAKVPVITLAHNAGRHWPSKSFIKYPGTIRVRIGPLIETEGSSVDDVHQQSSQWILQQMAEIDR